MLNKVEKVFQTILWHSKVMIVLPVIAGIFSALLMVIIGTLDVYHALKDIMSLFTASEDFHHVSKDIIMSVISSVDAFLIATVLLIFSIGLYELFIKKLDENTPSGNDSKILVIEDLDQLKEKLAKVIIMVLIVTFFQQTMNFQYKNVWDLLGLSVGILLTALAVFFTHKKYENETIL
jgi:uncharacterized membrane protein YqhA